MLWLKKRKFKKGLEANKLIHDAIVMGIADKYIEEENLRNNDFELQLLGRALNWAVPDLEYDFEGDLEKIEDKEIKKKIMEEEDKIFEKGLYILNSDPVVEDLITHYISYEMYLAGALFDEDEKKQHSGLERMRKFLFQNLDPELDVMSKDFCKNYKKLFVQFNNKYGSYGKLLNKETINTSFSFIENGVS